MSLLSDLFGRTNPAVPSKLVPAKSPKIPAAYYSPTPGYVKWDKNIPASDLKAINDQQARRNAAFEEWISAVDDVCNILGNDLVYVFKAPQGNDSYPVSANRAKLRIPSISAFWLGDFTHYHMDLWVPAQAALVALSNVADFAAFPPE